MKIVQGRFTIGSLAVVLAAGIAAAQAPAVPASTPAVADVATNAAASKTNTAPIVKGAPVTSSVLSVPIAGAPVPVPAELGSSGQWEVGTRYLNDSLQDKTRGKRFVGSFVGSITELKNKQDDVPDKVFAQGRIMDWPVWAGLSYDRVRAMTWDGATDGNVDLRGVIPYVQGVWANSTRFTPYAEVGFAWYQSKFDADPGWSQGGTHVMNLDNTTGVEIGAGTGIRIYKNLAADIYLRYMKVNDVTGVYTLNGSKEDDIVFTMSYVAYGLGVTYVF